MTIYVLTAASGAPGVTTTALGLALTWPTAVCLVDADPHAALAVPAGYLRGAPLPQRGLLGVAEAIRESRNFDIASHCVPLAPGEPQRLFLPGPIHPTKADMFAPIWRQLLPQLHELEMDVIIDAGRLTESGLPDELLTADRVLVVLRSSLPSVTGAQLYLPALQQQIAESVDQPRLELLLVGQRRPYKASEIQSQFGLPMISVAPWDETSAAVLSEGIPPETGFAQSRLWRALTATAAKLAVRHE